MEIKLNIISKHKKEIMGVATLLVMLVHIWYDTMPYWLDTIRTICQVGVDIFLLLSGLGCYFSLQKNSVGKFYWHRFRRVVIPYLIVFLGYNAFRYYVWDYSLYDAYSTYSMGSLIINNSASAWFILCIILFYLIAPWLYKSILREDHTSLYVLFVLIIIGSCQAGFLLPDPWYGLNEYIIARFPVFMVGMYLAMKLNHLPERTIKVGFKFWFLYILTIAASIINFFYNKMNPIIIFRYLAMPLSYFMCISLGMLFDGGTNKVLSLIGSISLECYLLFERIQTILFVYIKDITNIEINLISFVITIILGFILNKVINTILGDNKNEREEKVLS